MTFSAAESRSKFYVITCVLSISEKTVFPQNGGTTMSDHAQNVRIVIIGGSEQNIFYDQK